MRSVAIFGPILMLAASRAAAQEAVPAAALPSIELPPAPDRVLRDYERAWQARDAAALAALFTEDGFVLGNGAPPIRGRAAIRAAYGHGGDPSPRWGGCVPSAAEHEGQLSSAWAHRSNTGGNSS
jgi:hypothetical protein